MPDRRATVEFSTIKRINVSGVPTFGRIVKDEGTVEVDSSGSLVPIPERDDYTLLNSRKRRYPVPISSVTLVE